MGAEEKQRMRDLVQTGGPWSDAQREAIMRYCQSDVDALRRLLPAGYVVNASRIADRRMILAGYRLADLLIQLTQN